LFAGKAKSLPWRKRGRWKKLRKGKDREAKKTERERDWKTDRKRECGKDEDKLWKHFTRVGSAIAWKH
jgi:hypothetical protein